MNKEQENQQNPNLSSQEEVKLEGDIALHHKGLLKFEENVALNKFDYTYLYSYPEEGKEYAVIKLVDKPYIIHFYFGRTFCYELRAASAVGKGISLFHCNTLRDIISYLKEKENGKKNENVES